MISSGVIILTSQLGYRYVRGVVEEIESDYDILYTKLLGDYEENKEIIIGICERECNYKIRRKTTRRFKEKILKYIEEYNDIGHNRFVLLHKKKEL